jgi:putative two-component system response regulator
MSPANGIPRDANEVGNVLIVDDEHELRAALRRIMSAAGHTVFEACSEAEALQVLRRSPVDVLVLDLSLPDGSGLELLKTVKSWLPSTAVLIFTASNATQDMRDALRLGASAFVRKPADALTLEAQVSVALAQARATRVPALMRDAPDPVETALASGDLGASLEQLPFHLASQLSHAWDLRHVETGAHVRRMAESTRRLALALGSSDARASRLGRVAMLHDIGKIAIPDAILSKRGKLDPDELSIMKRHAEIGGELLSGSQHPFLDLAATVARSHHERWNGSGYPDGLVETACPWEARLVGIVDVYDALGHARCYKPAWSRQQLVDYFETETGRLFDPEMARALVASLPELEAVKSEYPDPIAGQYASGSRLKSAETSASVAEGQYKT